MLLNIIDAAYLIPQPDKRHKRSLINPTEPDTFGIKVLSMRSSLFYALAISYCVPISFKTYAWKIKSDQNIEGLLYFGSYEWL